MKLLCLALLLPLSAFAADRTELPQKDDVLVALDAAIPLRDSTPDPTFGGLGKKIGWVNSGEHVRVLETRLQPAVAGNQVWLHVEKEDSTQGWVLDGQSSEGMAGRASFSVVQSARALEEPKESADSLVQDSD